jgi:hypothetical protein
MRCSIILLPLALCAAPAVAQPVPEADQQAVQVPPELTDPAIAGRLTDAMQSLSQALLDLHVGRIQATLEGRKATTAERNLTLREVERRKDPNFERNLDQRIAAARPKIEQGIRAMNQALPEMSEDLQRAQRAIERATANMPDPNYPRR